VAQASLLYSVLVIQMSSEIPFHNMMEEAIRYKQMISRKTFYKYQRINRYTISNLSRNLLYFSHPSEFNDPFDSKMYADYRAKEEQWNSFICNRDGCDPEEARTKMKDFIKCSTSLTGPENHRTSLRFQPFNRKVF
jgi:hypothetical protein